MAERSVLITGCSSGIGLCAAQTLKARGWRVFARQPEDITRLKNEIGVESLYLDYAEPHSIAAAAEHVLSATDGTLTALYNNGGYGQPGALEDIRPDVLRAQFEVNVFGWHDLTRRVIPAMRARGEGRIVFCSSVLGLIGAPYRGSYSASKFAVEALADTLRMELQGSGIYVSLIEPGPIATRFVERGSRPTDAMLISKPLSIAISIASASPAWRPAVRRPTSSVRRLWPASSSTRLRARIPNFATTSPFPPTPWRYCADSCQRSPSTPWPSGTSFLARQAFIAH